MNDEGEGDAGTLRLRRQYAGNIDNRMQAAAIGVLALAAMAYPVAVQWMVVHLGLRTTALGLTLGGVALALTARSGTARLARLATTALAATALAGGTLLPLLVLPAFLYLGLAAVFLASLRRERSLVELGARAIQPAAPDFIGPYCRRATAMWAAVFVVNAIVLAVSAVAWPVETWKWLASYGVWSWMAVVSVAEFLVRKTYFRNYWYRGPFERLWSRLFPAEATPMGRRSAEYIRETRRKLGLPD